MAEGSGAVSYNVTNINVDTMDPPENYLVTTEGEPGEYTTPSALATELVDVYINEEV